jgi:hypothetical protein
MSQRLFPNELDLPWATDENRVVTAQGQVIVAPTAKFAADMVATANRQALHPLLHDICIGDKIVHASGGVHSVVAGLEDVVIDGTPHQYILGTHADGLRSKTATATFLMLLQMNAIRVVHA